MVLSNKTPFLLSSNSKWTVAPGLSKAANALNIVAVEYFPSFRSGLDVRP